jgi:hypothetical protein
MKLPTHTVAKKKIPRRKIHQLCPLTEFIATPARKTKTKNVANLF